MKSKCENCEAHQEIIRELIQEIVELKQELAMTERGLNKEQRIFYEKVFTEGDIRADFLLRTS